MAQKEYLDENGVRYFWQKIKNKFVVQESGKGLSTNDYTTTEKNKLSGIASGAEVNVQSDWNVTDTASDAFIKNKPTIPSAITVDSALSSTSTNPVQNKVINTALNGKVNTVSGKGLSTNDYTTTEKNKLAGIASGAEVNQNAFSTLSALNAAGTQIGSVSASSKTATVKIKTGSNISMSFDTDNSLLIALQNSPTLTGSPTANTPSAGTNNGQIATTAFVTTAIANAQMGAATFQGTAPTNFAPTNYKKGYYWVVLTAGTYAGQTCESGDMIFAINDYESSYKAADFSVVQTNLDLGAISNDTIDDIVAS